ncbi:hypothetical protein RIF29_23701 [Crotalaria pallida]|uniref:Uncharacterized protein n=1 Tax=Crotalaria pallida TaxID=3830 RepID=A0AAN9IF98_CROPI
MSKKETMSSVWTEEKHVHFLNTMEASFVTTMLHRYRLDRHLPDTSDSTLDSKPPSSNHNNNKKHAPSSSSDSVVPRARRTKRKSSQPLNSSPEQKKLCPCIEA